MLDKSTIFITLAIIISIILFGLLAMLFGTNEPIRDLLLTSLVVSYILKNSKILE